MPLRIIRATPDDAPRVAPLFDAYRVFYDKPGDPAAALAFLTERLERRESAVYLALDHDERTRTDTPAGFTQLYPAFSSVSLARTWILNDLFVAPTHRNRGVARLLMAAADAHARATAASALSLLTARNNAPARALYESEGWVRDERFFRYTKAVASVPFPSGPGAGDEKGS